MISQIQIGPIGVNRLNWVFKQSEVGLGVETVI